MICDDAAITFYDKNRRFHSIKMHVAVRAAHLVADHGMSIRQANRRTGLTDLEVREAVHQLIPGHHVPPVEDDDE